MRDDTLQSIVDNVIQVKLELVSRMISERVVKEYKTLLRIAEFSGLEYHKELSNPVERRTFWGLWVPPKDEHSSGYHWNPLRNDDDALRLASQFEIFLNVETVNKFSQFYQENHQKYQKTNCCDQTCNCLHCRNNHSEFCVNQFTHISR